MIRDVFLFFYRWILGLFFEFSVLTVKRNRTIKTASFHDFGHRSAILRYHLYGFLHSDLIEVSFEGHADTGVE